MGTKYVQIIIICICISVQSVNAIIREAYDAFMLRKEQQSIKTSTTEGIIQQVSALQAEALKKYQSELACMLSAVSPEEQFTNIDQFITKGIKQGTISLSYVSDLAWYIEKLARFREYLEERKRILEIKYQNTPVNMIQQNDIQTFQYINILLQETSLSDALFGNLLYYVVKVKSYKRYMRQFGYLSGQSQSAYLTRKAMAEHKLHNKGSDLLNSMLRLLGDKYHTSIDESSYTNEIELFNNTINSLRKAQKGRLAEVTGLGSILSKEELTQDKRYSGITRDDLPFSSYRPYIPLTEAREFIKEQQLIDETNQFFKQNPSILQPNFFNYSPRELYSAHILYFKLASKLVIRTLNILDQEGVDTTNIKGNLELLNQEIQNLKIKLKAEQNETKNGDFSVDHSINSHSDAQKYYEKLKILCRKYSIPLRLENLQKMNKAVNKWYRNSMLTAHPDKGGNEEECKLVNEDHESIVESLEYFKKYPEACLNEQQFRQHHIGQAIKLLDKTSEFLAKRKYLSTLMRSWNQRTTSTLPDQNQQRSVLGLLC